MVRINIGYKTGAEISEEVVDEESFENVREMTGTTYDEDLGKNRPYVENISEITIDGVSSEGDDYDAFYDWLSDNLGSFDPTIVHSLNAREDEERVDNVLTVTGGDIPSPSAGLVIKNLFPELFEIYYQNWRRLTISNARSELIQIENPMDSRSDFIQDIINIFGFN
jgi:hypothetical protein